MQPLYEAVVKLNPKSKKNSQRILVNHKTGRPFIMQSEEYEQYEQDCGWYLKRPRTPINEPVNVKCIFYRNSRRRVDLSNLLNAILDILTLYGIIVDDNRDIVYSMDGSRVLYDKENPRTEITITAITEVDVWGKK